VGSRFEILAEAGRGGMGTVFRARDWRDRRDVALKVLGTRDAVTLARFEREAALLAEIDHPNVVDYIAHGAVPDGPCWLAMTWVEGETLADRLSGAGLDAAETIVVATQVADALGALHARGIVHRDVKPSNLMLVGGDVQRVKLVDFGVARHRLTVERLTSTGVMVGTAGFMAPEQVRGDHAELDGRTDLFALGCVMHECLTGAAAFRGASTLACRAKVLLHDPPRLRKLVPALPAALDELVAALLARRAADRPANAAAVLAALAAIGPVPALRPSYTAPTGGDTSTTAPAGRAPRVCAVLVADLDAAAIARAHAGAAATVEPFDGGVVITVDGTVDAAAQLAFALAAQLPDALIAVVAAPSIDAAIDDGARLLDEVALAAAGRGAAARGVWLEAPRAAEVGSFAIERDGARARLVRERA
jgi:hypothetical protein